MELLYPKWSNGYDIWPSPKRSGFNPRFRKLFMDRGVMAAYSLMVESGTGSIPVDPIYHSLNSVGRVSAF